MMKRIARTFSGRFKHAEGEKEDPDRTESVHSDSSRTPSIVVEDASSLSLLGPLRSESEPPRSAAESSSHLTTESAAQLHAHLPGTPEAAESGKRLRALSASHMNMPLMSLSPTSLRREEQKSPVPYRPLLQSPRRKRSVETRETTTVSREEVDDDAEIINQYTMYKMLGRGAFGVVRLAIDNETNQRYAIKVLNKKRLRKKGPLGPPRPGPPRATPLDDVRREIAILKKLQHANVVRLIEVMDDTGQDSLFLVFELVGSGAVMEIKEVQQVEPLSLELTHRYFVHVVLALEYLHHKHIIHRDIKPGNILIDDDGIAKITDFGVSHITQGSQDELSATKGSPAFLAPEVLNTDASSYHGRPVDVWALGITLFCFGYGSVPFVGSNILDLHEKIRSDPVSFPSRRQLPSDYKDIVLKMLTKDPSKRITIPQIRDHPFTTCNGSVTLPSIEENCAEPVEVTDEEVENAVRTITSISTLLKIKAMGKAKTFNLSRVRSSPMNPKPSENTTPQ